MNTLLSGHAAPQQPQQPAPPGADAAVERFLRGIRPALTQVRTHARCPSLVWC
jgi:hypothetical protein